jgi:hypothetical protein
MALGAIYKVWTGNTATSTRTIIVEAQAPPAADATTSAATSTSQ